MDDPLSLLLSEILARTVCVTGGDRAGLIHIESVFELVFETLLQLDLPRKYVTQIVSFIFKTRLAQLSFVLFFLFNIDNICELGFAAQQTLKLHVLRLIFGQQAINLQS